MAGKYCPEDEEASETICTVRKLLVMIGVWSGLTPSERVACEI